MSVEVDFGQWGVIALAPGQRVNWWFTWIFDGNHWSRVSAQPEPWSPTGGSVQIAAEWANPGTQWVQFYNNGGDYVYFTPTFIVTPSRY